MSAPSTDHSASGRHIQQASQAPDDRSQKNKTELPQELIDALHRLPDPTTDVPPPMQYSNCWMAYRSSFVSIVKTMLPDACKSQPACTREASARYKLLTASQKRAWKDYAELSRRMHDPNPNSRGAKRKRTADLALTISTGGLLAQFNSQFTSAPVPSSPADTGVHAAEHVVARTPSSGRAPRSKSARESRASPLGSESRSGSAQAESRGSAPPAPLSIPPANLHAPSPLSAVSLCWDPRVDPALAFVSGGNSASGSRRHSPSSPPPQLGIAYWPTAQPSSVSPVQMQEGAQTYMYPVEGQSAWVQGEVQYPSALPSDARYARLPPLSDRTTGEGYGLQHLQMQPHEHISAAPMSGPSQELKDHDYDCASYPHAQQTDPQSTLHVVMDSPNAWSYTSSPDTNTLALAISYSDAAQFAPQAGYSFLPQSADDISVTFDYSAFVQPQVFYAPDNSGCQ